MTKRTTSTGHSTSDPSVYSDCIGIDRPFLTDIELAERWRMSPKTLRNLRVQGGHVPFVRIGRLVRYPREAILEFERKGLVFSGEKP